MDTNLSYKDLEPIIREQLAKGGKVRLKPRGVSMLPLIQPAKDEIILKPINRPIKKYDIIFYKRKSGQFVLHRVIKVRKDDYVLCGDGQIVPEYGVTDDMIIARVSGIIFNGDKYCSVKKSWIRHYAKRHVFHQQVKYFFVRVKNKLRRIVKKEQSTGQK